MIILRPPLSRPPVVPSPTTTVPKIGPMCWCCVGAAVPPREIAEATRLLFTLANLKAEPTGALALAGVLLEANRFRGQRVCCVVTGGNVDLELYARILRGGSG